MNAIYRTHITSKQYQTAVHEFLNDPVRNRMIRDMGFLTVFRSPVFIMFDDGRMEEVEKRWISERAKETYLKLENELQEYSNYLIGKLMHQSDNYPIKANDEK
jgi:hypothetical protein